ncbi:TetR family transcriptional regulator [Nocardioides sp. R-C-SC26]|uniref:TetR/AcrR family transcriptional regulator n=1 Tax=Nocardioides sp. R-C-SC26 TaxID=2870414 RepID=UPI001E3978C4|nr:TetR family transcriptional regulator [Nocardioides sp. R-C-SC26]
MTGEGLQRSGAAATKDAIREAARALFHERGYTGASVRLIAGAAQVDPALVIRYFGSKEGLFLDVVQAMFAIDEVDHGPLEDVGCEIVRAILTRTPPAMLEIWRAMVRASDSERVREQMIDTMERVIIAPLAPRLAGPEPELRARLVAAQVSGLLDAIALLGDARIVSASTDTLVELYGAAIQTLVDGVPAVDDAR